jgi:hypothetical protein
LKSGREADEKRTFRSPTHQLTNSPAHQLTSSLIFVPLNENSAIMENPFILKVIFGLVRYLLIFGGIFFLLQYYLKNSKKEIAIPSDKSTDDRLQPLRLQAYERFVLFLERSNPSALVFRLNSQGLTAFQLQALVVKTIREEFDYNLSQQLYISNALWDMIKNAKEESIAMINQAVSDLTSESDSGELVRSVYALSMQKNNIAGEEALVALKKEMNQRMDRKG